MFGFGFGWWMCICRQQIGCNITLAAVSHRRWMPNVNECNWLIDSHIHSVASMLAQFFDQKIDKMSTTSTTSACITIDCVIFSLNYRQVMSTHDNWIIFREVPALIIRDWNWIHTRKVGIMFGLTHRSPSQSVFNSIKRFLRSLLPHPTVAPFMLPQALSFVIHVTFVFIEVLFF